LRLKEKAESELPELYRLTDGADNRDGVHTVSTSAADISPEIDAIIADLAQRIYNGEKITYDPDLLQATVKPYLDGIAKGYGKSLADVDWNTPDAKTLQKLTENVFQFSASKDFHILSDMTAALKDSNGKMRSFDDFQAEVDKMNVKYNQNWLRTEYNQAVAASQNAARWTDFEKHSKTMPFLQYQAVMDQNTRAEHAALNGVIKRIDSDFWDKYYPPNGWGCRCEVIQLPGKNYKETPAADMKYCKVDDMWKVNVGKKGVVFPKGHPYFMGQCSTNSCPLKSRKLADGTLKSQCQVCLLGMGECEKYVEGCKGKSALIAERRQEYEQYKNDPDYLDVAFDPKTGGLKARHRGHNKNKKGSKIEGLTPYQIELACQDAVFKMGGSCILENEGMTRSNGEFAKCLDVRINGVLMDIRTITLPTTKIENALTDKHKQLVGHNKDFGENASTVCLYFHNPLFYSKEKIIQGISSYKTIMASKKENTVIKKVIVVVEGKETLLEFDI